MSADWKNEVAVAQRVAREAGRILLEVYARPFEVTEKAHGGGPVTEADERANTFIVQELSRAFPLDAIVAEESENAPAAVHQPRCWFVDPLDGTAEFVLKNGMFAVHIGLAVNGQARVGVVYRPVGDKLYTGVVGGECTLEEGGQTRVLHVSDRKEPSSLRLVVSRSHRAKATEQMREALGIVQVIESGSVGLKCGLLAEGAADLYLHPSDGSWRWDACAPEAVLRAAGGVFTDILGAEFRYDAQSLRNEGGILACNAAAHPVVTPVVERLARSFERQRAARSSPPGQG